MRRLPLLCWPFLTFEAKQSLGDKVLAKWTRNYNRYVAQAQIIRVKKTSFLVRLLNVPKEQDGTYSLAFPMGTRISIPRFANKSKRFWSENNRIEPRWSYSPTYNLSNHRRKRRPYVKRKERCCQKVEEGIL